MRVRRQHKQYLDHAARCFHNTLNFQKSLFGYTPSEKISVFIEDFGDFGNGGATSVPRNFISMGISPYSYAFETSPAGERIFATLNHEVVHVVALDNSTKADRFFQGMFMGKVQPNKEHPITLFYGLLTTPRYFAPRWYHEGGYSTSVRLVSLPIMPALTLKKKTVYRPYCAGWFEVFAKP